MRDGDQPTVTEPPSTVWEIPEPLSSHDVQVDDDTVIILRRHGNPEGPRLVLSHGNGLAVDLYYPFWSLLTKEFDLVVYDLRNHGWNEVGALADHSVDAFARDQDRVFEAIDSLYGEKPTVGIFHSISALAALHLPSKGGNCSALVLFDPPLCNTGSGYRQFELRAKRMAQLLRRRAQRFQAREDLAELHSYQPYFQRSVPGVLELVARTTLGESQTGDGFELRCPSEYEAQIWDHASLYAVSVDFSALRCPTIVVASDPALLGPDVAIFNYGEADVGRKSIPGTTHFLQLEKPEECKAALMSFLEEQKIL